MEQTLTGVVSLLEIGEISVFFTTALAQAVNVAPLEVVKLMYRKPLLYMIGRVMSTVL